MASIDATWIVDAHVLSTWAMAGIIVFVQIVHYPLMRLIPAEGFAHYALTHQRRITFVVGPFMLIEALSLALLLAGAGGQLPLVGLPETGSLLVGALLLFVIWGSTGAVQVPCHARLSQGKDEVALSRLILSNWIRTIGWVLRAALVATWLQGSSFGSP